MIRMGVGYERGILIPSRVKPQVNFRQIDTTFSRLNLNAGSTQNHSGMSPSAWPHAEPAPLGSLEDLRRYNSSETSGPLSRLFYTDATLPPNFLMKRLL